MKVLLPLLSLNQRDAHAVQYEEQAYDSMLSHIDRCEPAQRTCSSACGQSTEVLLHLNRLCFYLPSSHMISDIYLPSSQMMSDILMPLGPSVTNVSLPGYQPSIGVQGQILRYCVACSSSSNVITASTAYERQ